MLLFSGHTISRNLCVGTHECSRPPSPPNVITAYTPPRHEYSRRRQKPTKSVDPNRYLTNYTAPGYEPSSRGRKSTNHAHDRYLTKQPAEPASSAPGVCPSS